MEKILLWAAMLLAFGVSAVFAEDVRDKSFTLDMAENSVDDRYNNCKDKMRDKVTKEYLDNERNTNANFTLAWTKADAFYKEWVKKTKSPQYQRLQKEHVMAVYVYSLESPKVYGDFNQAVRTKRAQYTSSRFRYHALHFYLTDAIQTLHAQTDGNCVTTYRRVKISFTKVEVNKEFRFGAFTSGSLNGYPSLKIFGEKSCFKITTCFGADISCCTMLGKHEREVLIPPYEVFKVTDIEKRSAGKNLPCEVVYTVQSTKSLRSNLNCALFPKLKKGKIATP